MNQQVNSLIMNADENMGNVERSPLDEQLFRKQRLAAALRRRSSRGSRAASRSRRRRSPDHRTPRPLTSSRGRSRTSCRPRSRSSRSPCRASRATRPAACPAQAAARPWRSRPRRARRGAADRSARRAPHAAWSTGPHLHGGADPRVLHRGTGGLLSCTISAEPPRH